MNQAKKTIKSIQIKNGHAADARYHNACWKKFFDVLSCKPLNTSTKSVDHDDAFVTICNVLLEDRSKIWSSVELFEMYAGYGGNLTSNRSLVTKILQYFDNKIVVLSSPGLANILAFRQEAGKAFHMNDEDSAAIEKSGFLNQKGMSCIERDKDSL